MRPRRSVLGLLGLAAAAAAGVPILAQAGPGAVAPDLRADPPERVSGPEFYSIGGIGSGRLLVRFDGFVTNIGEGPLEVSGNPKTTGANGVQQRAATPGWTGGTLWGQPTSQIKSRPLLEVQYESADGHNHFHLMRVMRYSLWNVSRTAQAAPGQKVGFCLYDLALAPLPRPDPDPQLYTEAITDFCEQDQRDTTSLIMGTSSGWRDVYHKDLAYQWVDVSETPPGEYYVAAEADPDDVVWEGDGPAESNPIAFASTKITVPGWIAQPVSVPQNGGQQTILLATQKFGAQSDSLRRFRIVDPPDHGTLDVAAGSDFSAQSVTYTPNPGYSGPDSFTYVAKRSGWNYPLNPPQAAVTITSAAPSVSISGAPASLIAGTSAQLTATTANVGGPVSWSVNGVAGGNATVGTVTPGGLYTAPAAPPPGGSVTITASAGSAAGQAAIQILPKPKQVPLPAPGGAISAGSKLLSPVAVRTLGKRTVIGRVVTGRKAGRVTMTVTFKRRVLGRCVARVPARRAFTCKVKMPRQYPFAQVRVTAKLKAGKATAVRRSFARR